MKQTIIDLGCGTGNELKRFYKKNHVVGIDIDEKNIAICKKEMPNGDFFVEDIANIDFSKYKKIKKVICTEVLEHVDDWKRIVVNLKKLPPKTELYITVPYYRSEKKLLKLRPDYWKEIGHQHFFNGAEIKKALTEVGYQNIKIKRFNAALYFELQSLFKRNAKCIRHTYYEQILPLPLTLFYQLFRPNLFQTKLKWIPVWLITLPIAWVLDKVWGAGIQITATKNSSK